MGDRAGQQLGNYTLLHLLGKGGFAEVYLARHRYLDTQAAVKVLNVQKEQAMRNLILQEARVSAGLDHPHISRVLEFGFSGEGVPFLVMPYAPGGSLRQLHPPGSRLTLERIVWYIRQIAEALQYAHDRGVVHRDVKPENLLLGQRSEVLLSDFGIAFIADESHTKSEQEMAGTARYMAPEQAKKRAKAASDQYALAAVTYEWIAGDPPFPGSSFIEIALKHQTEQPPPLQGRTTNVDWSLLPEVEEVVMRALAKDPARRFKNVMDFAQALETICRSSQRPQRVIRAGHVHRMPQC
jgi:eukaryotic-like serine/threonine-protein kinase